MRIDLITIIFVMIAIVFICIAGKAGYEKGFDEGLRLNNALNGAPIPDNKKKYVTRLKVSKSITYDEAMRRGFSKNDLSTIRNIIRRELCEEMACYLYEHSIGLIKEEPGLMEIAYTYALDIAYDNREAKDA